MAANFLALGIAFLAVVLIVSCTVCGYTYGVGTVYSATQASLADGAGGGAGAAWDSDPEGSGYKALVAQGEAGAAWIRRAAIDAYIWAGVLLAAGGFFLYLRK